MLENTNYQETVSTSAQSMAANSPTAVTSADVSEPESTEAPKSLVASEFPSQNTTIVGTDVIFKGELIAGDNIIIHGTVEGMIARHTKNVTVGKKGRVRALVHAGTVTVQGQVDGDIYGDELVELMDGARVLGNIFSSCVRIEKGAEFNGTISMA